MKVGLFLKVQAQAFEDGGNWLFAAEEPLSGNDTGLCVDSPVEGVAGEDMGRVWIGVLVPIGQSHCRPGMVKGVQTLKEFHSVVLVPLALDVRLRWIRGKNR